MNRASFAFVLGFCCLLVRRTGAPPAKQFLSPKA